MPSRLSLAFGAGAVVALVMLVARMPQAPVTARVVVPATVERPMASQAALGSVQLPPAPSLVAALPAWPDAAAAEAPAPVAAPPVAPPPPPPAPEPEPEPEPQPQREPEPAPAPESEPEPAPELGHEQWTSSASTSSVHSLNSRGVLQLDRVAFVDGKLHTFALDEAGRSVGALRQNALAAYKGFDGSAFLNPAPKIVHNPAPLADVAGTCATVWRGNSFFHSPWLLINLFHTHNDNFLPLADNALDAPGGLAAERHLFLYRDYRKRKQYVSLADVMWRFFDSKNKADDVMRGGPHCFETVRWGRGEVFFYKKYTDKARRRDVLASVHQWMLAAYSLAAQNAPLQRSRPPAVVTWMRREWKKDRDDRFLANFGAMQAAFRAEGMALEPCCDFASMSVVDTLRLMLRSDVVIGVHGAGLTNALYMREGTLLVEIKHEYKFDVDLFQQIAHSRRMVHVAVNAKKTGVPNKGLTLPQPLMADVAKTVRELWENPSGTGWKGRSKLTVTL